MARKVTLVIAFGFLPQNFGMVVGACIVFCHSVSAVSVVRTPTVGGGTQTLIAIIEFV